MQFFEDFKIDKESHVGITNLLSNITTRPDSHKGGWSRLLKCQLKNMGFKNVKIFDNKDSLQLFDVIIFDLGAEYSGTLNLFGGLDVKVFKRLAEIESYKGRFFSWKNELPSLLQLEGRRNNASSCEQFKSTDSGFLQRAEDALKISRRFDHAYRTNSLLIGDSHTPGVWLPEFMIERQDGRTLYGATKNKTVTELVTKHGPLHTVKIHMSSIDIRHHVLRQPNYEESIHGMLTLLGQELIDLRNSEMIQKVILTETMGIEDESRELPKTGYYKGTSFYGDWNQRNSARLYFNEKIKEQCYLNNKPGLFEWSLESYPEHFFDEAGKLRFEVMELPGSVHISPSYYKMDLDANQERWGVQTLCHDIEKDMYGA